MMFKRHRTYGSAFILGLAMAFIWTLGGGALVEAVCTSVADDLCGPEMYCIDECEPTAAFCRIYKQAIQRTPYDYCIVGYEFGNCVNEPSPEFCYSWFRCTRSNTVCGSLTDYYYCTVNPAVGGVVGNITLASSWGACEGP